MATIARCLIAFFFVASGAGKIFAFRPSSTILAFIGFPIPTFCVTAFIAIEIAGGNSAKRDDSSHRSNGVGTAAEAEEKNPVLGLGEPDNRCIAVNYVLGDA